MTYEYNRGAFALTYEGPDMPPYCESCQTDCTDFCEPVMLIEELRKIITEMGHVDGKGGKANPDYFNLRVRYWANRLLKVIGCE